MCKCSDIVYITNSKQRAWWNWTWWSPRVDSWENRWNTDEWLEPLTGMTGWHDTPTGPLVVKPTGKRGLHLCCCFRWLVWWPPTPWSCWSGGALTEAGRLTPVAIGYHAITAWSQSRKHYSPFIRSILSIYQIWPKPNLNLKAKN